MNSLLNEPKKVFIPIIIVLLLFITPQLHSQLQGNHERTGMLILGSNNLTTLTQRVTAGLELYKTKGRFNYIIVSGGCGAHGSNICEASEMKELLIKKGIPAGMIYKEEQSGSTIQNYCYSRILKKKDGSRIIQPHDKLYVVSNHWHAIPVTARFRKYDNVDAEYYITGHIIPKDSDEVNYYSIYEEGNDSDCYCKDALPE